MNRCTLALTIAACGTVSSLALAQESADSPIETGRVLLNGTFVAPPYELAFDGSVLRLNNDEIARLVPYAPPAHEPVGLDTIWGVSMHAIGAFQSLKPVTGLDVAMSTAQTLLDQSPLVTHTDRVSAQAIEVTFINDPDPTLVIFRDPVDPAAINAARARSIREHAEVIEHGLRRNALVVLHDGVLIVTAWDNGPHAATAIEAAVTAEMTRDDRRSAVAKIIPDARTARRLADTMTDRKEASE